MKSCPLPSAFTGHSCLGSTRFASNQIALRRLMNEHALGAKADDFADQFLSVAASKEEMVRILFLTFPELQKGYAAFEYVSNKTGLAERQFRQANRPTSLIFISHLESLLCSGVPRLRSLASPQDGCALPLCDPVDQPSRARRAEQLQSVGFGGLTTAIVKTCRRALPRRTSTSTWHLPSIRVRPWHWRPPRGYRSAADFS